MVKSLYFPGVRPEQRWIEALLPLTGQLIVYAVAEEPSPGAVPTPWELKVVAPLGGDARRFQSLLREMTGRDAAVIRGQMLATASLSDRDRDEASAGTLAAAMHHMGDGGVAGNFAGARAERIWQARLFLKLAEAVTVAETEISLAMAALDVKQSEMLRALQGEDDADGPGEALTMAPSPRPISGRFFRVRDQLAAWAVFYLLDPGAEPLLITDNPEAAALLVDEMEKRAPGRVISLPELDLGMAEKDLAMVDEALRDILAGKAGEGRDVLQALKSRHQLPESGGVASTVLKLHLLPGAEFRQLMVELSGLPGEDGATALVSPYVLVGATAPGEAYL